MSFHLLNPVFYIIHLSVISPSWNQLCGNVFDPLQFLLPFNIIAQIAMAALLFIQLGGVFFLPIICTVENPVNLELAHFSPNHFKFKSCLPKC